mmetsp:Transcript_11358/g.21790  ORF Transcript_11358/g.21790 Transcript_11358/m.21790 type:complete len:129 (-) Transcript_11358:1057-1443(-)
MVPVGAERNFANLLEGRLSHAKLEWALRQHLSVPLCIMYMCNVRAEKLITSGVHVCDACCTHVFIPPDSLTHDDVIDVYTHKRNVRTHVGTCQLNRHGPQAVLKGLNSITRTLLILPSSLESEDRDSE